MTATLEPATTLVSTRLGPAPRPAMIDRFSPPWSCAAMALTIGRGRLFSRRHVRQRIRRGVDPESGDRVPA